jgi:predicted phage tail protein
MSATPAEPTSTGAGATAVTSPAGVAAPEDRSVGELVSSLSNDLSRLVRDEMRLAQAEVSTKAKKAGVGVGAFGAAGVLALYAVGVLLAAAVLGLATALPAWLAALIVAGVVLVVAGVAALVGRKKVSEATPLAPTRTVESVKTDVQEIKESVQR